GLEQHGSFEKESVPIVYDLLHSSNIFNSYDATILPSCIIVVVITCCLLMIQLFKDYRSPLKI
ncbi:hypothetical protein A2U01_0108078, partial [Trifolium medium]|nr:hypothetical protein [Trifolium medium]